MTDTHLMSRSLTRRRFLTATSSLAAVGFAGASLPMGVRQASATGEQMIQSGSHWGVFKMTVKDGLAASIEPWEKDPHPSHQLPGVLNSMYSASRIRYPMVRRAYLENGPKAERDSRSAGDFVRASWDKAIELVANEIKRVQDEHDPSGIFAGSYGWKSPSKFHNYRTLVARTMNTLGGYVGGTSDYSTGAAQVIMPHVVGGLEVYSQQTSWPLLIENTDTLVLWGADPLKTCQIDWLIPDHGVYDYLKAYKDTGKKIICIDPFHSETAKMTGAEWIAPKPQTDTTLMLGIAHTVYEEGLHDEDFLSTYTYGFDQFVPYLMGEKDGTPKNAEWVAGICGVPADKIKELAHLFAGSKTMLASGWSIQRMQHAIRRTGPLDAGNTGLHAGPDRNARRWLRPQLSLLLRRNTDGQRRLPPRHRQRQAVRRECPRMARLCGRGKHSGGPHRRHAGGPQRRVRIQRREDDLPR